MRDPSPYAGQTVKLRADAAEIGGHTAEIVDWYESPDGLSWRAAAEAGDAKGQDYAIRRSLAGLPDDDEVLYARVDGMMRIIHLTEIEGYAPPAAEVQHGPLEARDIGAICPACEQPIQGGDAVSILMLGPGNDPDRRAKALAKVPYDIVCVEVHWACRTGDESYNNAFRG